METKEMGTQESVDRVVEAFENILERVVAPLRRPFKWVFNRNCYEIINVQEGIYVCSNNDPYCPYRAIGRSFRPQCEIIQGDWIFAPGKEYVMCSRKPKT